MDNHLVLAHWNRQEQVLLTKSPALPSETRLQHYRQPHGGHGTKSSRLL